MIKFFTISAFFALTCLPALADSSSARGLAIAFVGNCLNNAGRVDKIEAAAKALEYEELVGAQAEMFAPQDPNADFRGWIVRDGTPELYILGISRSTSEGEKMTSCVIANTNIDTEKTLKELASIIELGPLRFDGDETGQRNRIWDASLFAPNASIILTDAKKLGIEGGTFSLSAPSEE